MSKETYIQQLTITATAIAQSLDTANTLINAYFDRGYGSGGANELVAGDLAAAGISPANVASAITLFQQLQELRNGGAVAAADYDSTLNVLRRDI
jgi:hypothetical protein